MPTKAEVELPPEQVEALCAQLFRTPGGRTLRVIREQALKFGVELSPTSGAAAFRDGPLATYLDELKAKSDRAQQVAAYRKEGLSMTDAAKVRLSETVFDRLMDSSAIALTPEEQDTYSKIIARAEAGDQRGLYLESQLKLANERAEKLRAEAEARAEKNAQAKAALTQAKKKGGLTKETLQKIEEAAGLL